jgi:hypothetical protein
MKYTVDIDGAINDILKHNIGICPALQIRNEHVRLPFWLRDNPIVDLYHRDLSLNKWNVGASLARQILNDETLFPSPLFQLLFKSFVVAEGKFIKNYIPQNSHEERLTGHLVSELENGLFILRDYFEEASKTIYGEKIPLNFYYADLSSNRQEKNTGADLGLIFYVNLPDFQHIRIAAIQAKKAKKKSAIIDIDQLNKIVDVYEDNAYYMFYDMTLDRLSPMIRRASAIKYESKEKNDTKTYSYEREKIVERGVPVSIFLIFDMLSTSLQTFQNIWEAKNYLMYPKHKKKNLLAEYNDDNKVNRPSKILTISIGSLGKNEGLNDIRDLFKEDYPRIID